MALAPLIANGEGALHHNHKHTHTSSPLSQTPQGRSAVALAPLIANGEGTEDEMWFPLGRGDWTNPQGPVSHRVTHSR